MRRRAGRSSLGSPRTSSSFSLPSSSVPLVLPLAPRCVAFSVIPHEFSEVLTAFLVQVESVGGFGEPEVGVDTRNDDARVNGDELDPNERDLDERVDHQTLVEDQVEDLGEATLRGLLDAPTTLGLTDGHADSLPPVVYGASGTTVVFRHSPGLLSMHPNRPQRARGQT